LLQPLVENAVRHGIQPLREGGEIILRGHREGEGILIEIDNPLTGIPTPGGHGHGLDNVRQRVTYRYGARARVTVGPVGDRFVVRLQLPGQPGSHARTDR
jgi:two-component system sensor histidine kinase AlgZ